MRDKLHDVFWLPATVLFLLGVCDIARGVVHTFGLRYADEHVAGVDPVAAPTDKYFLLGVFGITDFLTGLVFILICRRACERRLCADPHSVDLSAWGHRHQSLAGVPRGRVHREVLHGCVFTTCVTTFAMFLVHKGHRGRPAPRGHDRRPANSPPLND